MNKNKTEKLVWIMFFFIGMIFFVIGCVICFNTFNYSNKIETTGVITEIFSHRDSDGDVDHDVYVSYEVNGNQYESKLNGYSSSYYKGKKIDIYYDKKNPEKIGTKSLDLLFIIFPGIGFIFLVIGGIGLLSKRIKNKKNNDLKLTGTRIDAKYIRTIINTRYAVNGQNPYVILCEGINPINGETMEFKSDNLWTNPESLIETRKITSFPVYINCEKPNKYVVDVDILEGGEQ